MKYPKGIQFAKIENEKPLILDLTPSPASYVNSLLVILNDSPKEKDRKWAKEELVRAMTIAMGVKEESNVKKN